MIYTSTEGTQAKKRDDNVARAIHWEMAGKCGFDRTEKWYEHAPGCIAENEYFKMR